MGDVLLEGACHAGSCAFHSLTLPTPLLIPLPSPLPPPLNPPNAPFHPTSPTASCPILHGTHSHPTPLPPQASSVEEIRQLEEQVLLAINATSAQALLEGSEVYDMLVALQVGEFGRG